MLESARAELRRAIASGETIETPAMERIKNALESDAVAVTSEGAEGLFGRSEEEKESTGEAFVSNAPRIADIETELISHDVANGKQRSAVRVTAADGRNSVPVTSLRASREGEDAVARAQMKAIEKVRSATARAAYLQKQLERQAAEAGRELGL